MTATLRKWKALFSIFFQEGIAYRASGVIWIMTDVVTAVTMPLVWANASRGGPVGGFTSSDFVLYYLSFLMVQSFVTSHVLWDVAMEIKEGQFSNYLLRPISFFQLKFISNFTWRLIRPTLFLPFFLLFLYLYRGYLSGAHVHMGWTFWASLFMGHALSFTFVLALSMIALYTQEAMAIFEVYYAPMMFLSGQLFPIAVLPQWAQKLAMFLPFYFTAGAPTEILVGRVADDRVPQILLGQALWLVFSYVMFRVLWKNGLKHYSGVGM